MHGHGHQLFHGGIIRNVQGSQCRIGNVPFHGLAATCYGQKGGRVRGYWFVVHFIHTSLLSLTHTILTTTPKTLPFLVVGWNAVSLWNSHGLLTLSAAPFLNRPCAPPQVVRMTVTSPITVSGKVSVRKYFVIYECVVFNKFPFAMCGESVRWKCPQNCIYYIYRVAQCVWNIECEIHFVVSPLV